MDTTRVDDLLQKLSKIESKVKTQDTMIQEMQEDAQKKHEQYHNANRQMEQKIAHEREMRTVQHRTIVQLQQEIREMQAKASPQVDTQ